MTSTRCSQVRDEVRNLQRTVIEVLQKLQLIDTELLEVVQVEALKVSVTTQTDFSADSDTVGDELTRRVKTETLDVSNLLLSSTQSCMSNVPIADYEPPPGVNTYELLVDDVSASSANAEGSSAAINVTPSSISELQYNNILHSPSNLHIDDMASTSSMRHQVARCKFCAISFTNTSLLREHQLNSHCHLMSSNRENGLMSRRHLSNMTSTSVLDTSTAGRPQPVPKKTTRGLFVCDFCSKQFKHYSVWTRHRVSHTKEKPFVCEVCDRRYRYRYLARRCQTSHPDAFSNG